MKKIRYYIANEWKAYLFGFTCMFLAVILDMLYPQITRIIINDVFTGGNISLLPQLLFGIVAIGIGRSIFQYGKEYTFDRTGSRIGTAMRKDLFRHIQSLSVDYFDKTNTGELMARVKDDIDKIWGVLGFVGMLVVEVVFHVSMVLYCMFHINVKLTMIPLAFMIICGVVAIVMERKLDQVYEQISEENAVLTTVAEENLAGVRTVKAFAREEFEIKKFLSHNKRYYELNMQQSKMLIRYNPIFQFVSAALPVACAVAGGFLVMRQEMNLGDLVAYVEYSRNCTWPMEMLGWLTNDVSSAIASHKKIQKICKETAHIKEQENPVILDEVRGKVCFDHVDFSLDGKEILKDISFTLEPGKTLGIMGATGAGKSTIVNLLERFYDPTAGEVRLDDINVKELTFQQVRGSSAVVMQDVFLFSDSIGENIRMGKREEVDHKTMVKAAELAQAKNFIEEMELQYDTVIGERGVGLSGGQKQRISIARAFSKKTPILVLDDSTSALDMETEHEIQKNLQSMDQVTKLIIAHRISSVVHADEIIYLDHGRIVERGTHKELMELGGFYYDTYQAQYGGENYGS